MAAPNSPALPLQPLANRSRAVRESELCPAYVTPLENVLTFDLVSLTFSIKRTDLQSNRSGSGDDFHLFLCHPRACFNFQLSDHSRRRIPTSRTAFQPWFFHVFFQVIECFIINRISSSLHIEASMSGETPGSASDLSVRAVAFVAKRLSRVACFVFSCASNILLLVFSINQPKPTDRSINVFVCQSKKLINIWIHLNFGVVKENKL